MSFYNLLFGKNPDSDKLMTILDLDYGSVGRFRDIYVKNNRIILYTRNGGGNRPDYKHVFKYLSKHPWYSAPSGASG